MTPNPANYTNYNSDRQVTLTVMGTSGQGVQSSRPHISEETPEKSNESPIIEDFLFFFRKSE